MGHANHNIWGFHFKMPICSSSVNQATAGGVILEATKPSTQFNIADNKWKKFGYRCFEPEANEATCQFVA